jgi:hypothetical protein
MAIIEWSVRKETFNPDKNYFNIDHVDVSRETSAEEDRLAKLACRYTTSAGWLIGVGIIGALFGGSALGALELWIWCVSALAFCIGCIIAGCALLNEAQRYDMQRDQYIKEHDVWRTPEVIAVEEYNKEQQSIAEKWRAEHPLEEKIRACLLDPKSSVDVANLARFYAIEYLKEIK